MHWQPVYRVLLALHRKGEDVLYSLSSGYIPRVDVMMRLVVMPNLMNQNICSIVISVGVFVQVLHKCY